MREIDVVEFLAIAAPVISALAAVAILTWWLSKQFENIRTTLTKRLEERFDLLDRRLWRLELQNALRDGKPMPGFDLKDEI